MLTLFGKKKLTEEKVANIFVNSVIDLIDEGFEEILGFINDSPEFVQKPKIDLHDNGKFTIIVIAANLSYISDFFPPGQDKRIIELSISKFSQVYGMDKMEFAKIIANYRKFMTRKNHPSKNTLYAMSKAFFAKYNLNQFQDEYFKNMDAPNPIFLQRLNEVMNNFIWNWSSLQEKYKIV